MNGVWIVFIYCIQFNFSQSYLQQSWQTAAWLVLLSFFTDNLHHRCDLEIKYDVSVWHETVWLWDTWEQMMFDVINVQPAAWVPYLIWEPQWRWRLSMNNDLYFGVINCSLKKILFAHACFVLDYQCVFYNQFHGEKWLQQGWVKLTVHIILWWFTFSWIKHMSDLAVRRLK